MRPGIDECPRCGDLVLHFVDAGLHVRLATKKLPADVAETLSKYGCLVEIVRRRPGGGWSIGTYVHGMQPGVNQSLHRDHVCGAYYETRRTV
jgi:hypothetical protein